MLEDQDDHDADDVMSLDEDDEEIAKTEAPLASARNPPSKPKKKKKKKAKPATTASPAQDYDEIDRALEQLSTATSNPTSGATTAGIDPAVDEANRLLAIDTAHLHAANEMRRLFGRNALDQQPDDIDGPPQAGGGRNRRNNRHAQQAGGLANALRGQGNQNRRSSGLAAMALRRNLFMHGKEDWPVATSGGLSMEVVETRADGTVLYRYETNRTYEAAQEGFNNCVELMDPERMIAHLQQNPYHISTLLQVSEIAKSESDHATSGDLLERALFSFGRAVHSSFPKNLAEGKARLNFVRTSNREFYLASWRYMQNLAMRGTWFTVYNWAKLLLSLSPKHDPYAIWLVLDQYALRSRQDLDYLNVSRNQLLASGKHQAPHIQLSSALAEYRAGNKDKGKQALFTAVGRYPWMVFRLMQELGLQPPASVWGTEPRTEREMLHAELYATRAKDVWNTPEATNLLVEVAAAVPEGTNPAEADDKDVIFINEARQIIIDGTPALIALLPKKFTRNPGPSGDPLPPETELHNYFTPGIGAADSDWAGRMEELLGLQQSTRSIYAGMGVADNLDGGHEEVAVVPEHDQPRVVAERYAKAGMTIDDFRRQMARISELSRSLTGLSVDEMMAMMKEREETAEAEIHAEGREDGRNDDDDDESDTEMR